MGVQGGPRVPRTLCLLSQLSLEPPKPPRKGPEQSPRSWVSLEPGKSRIPEDAPVSPAALRGAQNPARPPRGSVRGRRGLGPGRPRRRGRFRAPLPFEQIAKCIRFAPIDPSPLARSQRSLPGDTDHAVPMSPTAGDTQETPTGTSPIPGEALKHLGVPGWWEKGREEAGRGIRGKREKGQPGNSPGTAPFPPGRASCSSK